MKKFSEQFYKKATTVKLQKVEKTELRERLVSYMEYHPLPADMKTQKISNKKIASETVPFTEAYTNISIPFLKLFKVSAVAAALVLVVLPFAAERAVPGDTLYAVKVEFNEELRSTLIFDSFQKVEWETELLSRRIAEARLLASEGRLTEEVEAEVAAAVKTHTENAKREIEEIRTLDADEAEIASIALDSTLEVQSTSLKGPGGINLINPAIATGTRSANLIADVIDESRNQTNIEGQSASSSLPAYNKLMARVEQNTTRVYELLSTIREFAPEVHFIDVTRRIEDIERSIKEAIELQETDDSAARHQLIDVVQRTQKLIVYMTEIEVKETVDIETLVPVVLTETEEDALVVSMTEELETKVARINELYPEVEDTNVLEKVDFSLLVITEQSNIMATSADNLPAFRSVASEAIALADDTIILLERHLNPVEPTDGNAETSTTTDSVSEVEPDERATSTEDIVLSEETSASSTSTTTKPVATSSVENV